MTSLPKRLALTLALLLAIPQLAAAATAPGGGRWLVVFRSEKLPSNAAQLVSSAGGQTYRTLPSVGVLVAHGDATFAATLAKNTAVLAVGPENVYAVPEVQAVEYAGEDVAGAEAGPTSADNLYGYQWDMRRIGAPGLWARLPLGTGGRTATVAVLDTGVMDNHPDLVGQLVATRSTTYCNTSGGPGNTPSYPAYSTLIDFDAHPEWSPADGCTSVATTYESHGTHVAGTIAAKLGGGRVVGVNPDVRVAAYKVFDRYRYTGADGKVVDAVGAFDGPLFDAIVDATNRRIPVLSMSLGSFAFHSNQDDNASWLAWDRVAKYANRGGTLVVASAGNSEVNLNGQVAHLPSDLSTVMSTSATGWSELVLSGGAYVPAPGSHDVLAFYSDYGASVDLTAPGGDCGPAYPDKCVAQYLILNDYISPAGTPGYVFYAGTSMATPHVSAVAATVRALHPDWTPGDVRSFLKENAEPIGDRQAFGHGMIDADGTTR